MLLLAAAGLAACGNYSTDDVAFTEALPTAGEIQVAAPSVPSPSGCAMGDATRWISAQAVGVGMNDVLDWILGAVGRVRGVAPTIRRHDHREWGPSPDAKHPGAELLFVIVRSYDASGEPSYHFSYQARRPTWADPSWKTVIEGSFVGWSARTGAGALTIHFATIRSLLLYQLGELVPRNDVTASYDRTGDPRAISLSIGSGDSGYGLASFDYQFWNWSDGTSQFDYAGTNVSGDRVEVSAHFDPSIAGRGDVVWYPAATPTVGTPFSACWDGSGCFVAFDDPSGSAGFPGCTAGTPCSSPGWPAGCPTVKSVP